jgi:predicted Zn-dependent protease
MSTAPSPVALLANLLGLPQQQRDAILVLGQQELAAGKVQDSIETLEIATQLDPLDPLRWLALAEAMRAGGFPKHAALYAAHAAQISHAPGLEAQDPGPHPQEPLTP